MNLHILFEYSACKRIFGTEIIYLNKVSVSFYELFVLNYI